MTTKLRIIAGFSIMVFLLAAGSVMGYRALGAASENFFLFDGIARNNALIGDAGQHLGSAATGAAKFVLHKKTEDIDGALRHVEAARLLIEEALAGDAARAHADALAGVSRQLETLAQRFRELGAALASVLEEEEARYRPSRDALAKSLYKMTDYARTNANAEAAAQLSQLWESHGVVQRTVASFMESLDMAKAGEADAALSKMDKQIKFMRFIVPDEGKKEYDGITRAFADAAASFGALKTSCHEAQTKLAETAAITEGITATFAELRAVASAEMKNSAGMIVERAAAARKSTLLLSVFGFFGGICIAGGTIILLTRMLRGMEQFATRVAEGDFDYDPGIREKGEIGSMLEALRRIPVVLNEVVMQCDAAKNAVDSGVFRNRLDQRFFPGRFGQMAGSVNGIIEAFTRMLDELPVGFMTASPEKKICFMNKMLRDTLGKDLTGELCAAGFNGSFCNTPECCGDRCMGKAADIREDVRVETGGREIIMDLTASPMRGPDGTVLGFMEAATDVTRQRAAAQTIRDAAGRASGIAERLAAATEALSAHVGHVSDGAEEQQREIENTAGAMTQMGATVGEVAKSAAAAAQKCEESRENAESGVRLVEQVVDSIQTVHEISLRLRTGMTDLGQHAESVGGVISVISDIADQTNLLALNAAIEAARAGDSGRGFAVVADEVRKLAEKTMDATKKVSSDIRAIQEAAKTNIARVLEAAETVTKATDVATTSGDSIRGVARLVAETSALMGAIATAAEEQDASAGEITVSVNGLSGLVSRTAQGMRQSSGEVAALSRLAQDLTGLMHSLDGNV